MLERIFQEPKFRVCCLGAIKLVEAGSDTDMTPPSRKTRALLGYLCVVGKPVGRERLASLLWGDRGDEQARASLRQAIYELRSLLGGERLLKVERDTVAAGDDVGTDLAQIMAAARSDNLQQLEFALSAWRGDFFEDLPSIDPSFDAWLQAERPRVQENLVGAATEAANAGMARGEIDAARKIVGLLQQHDGTNEVVLRLGLRLDRLAGDSAALHRRYERFRELLKSELDAAPAAETQRLFDELTTKPPAVELFVPPPADDSFADEERQAVRQRGKKGRATPVHPTDAPATAEVETETYLPRHPAGRSRRWLRIAAAAVVIIYLCAIGWAISSFSPSRTEPLLAVMPFQNLGADTAARSFSAGISGEIADALQRTTQIRIASTPSSLDARAPQTPAATHVLSGSVERVGDRMHVIVQLMDIQDDSVIWSRAYDRAVAQAPALRHDLAVQIAAALGKLISSRDFGEAHRGSAAYDHYLNGRSLFLRNDPRAAAAELDASVRLAPDFANAWSTLAAVRMLIATDTFVQHKDAYDPAIVKTARAAAQRARALDPNNGEALGVLAMLVPSTRLQEIDRQLEHALRAEPYNAQLLGWRGEFLMFVGRNHEALDALTRAYVLDRAIPSVAPDLVLASLRSSRFERAREILDLADRGTDSRLRAKFLDLHMKYFLYRMDWFGMATWLSALPGQLAPPMAAFLRLCRETATALATRDADKIGGLRARWRTEDADDPDAAVQFLSALGDVDGALTVVQSAVRSSRNDAFLTDPKWEALFVPSLVPLRRDPRIPALLAQWGLSDYWRTANHAPDFMR
ncbi:MAG TPA: BTAD domain-containing putative transcriptional regulator [Rhizomicrobium sp.]|jgi:DNA-binding SARP family transcriptional activator/TolB-like protein|nr:BTAD domain-containing putative transcriptional regulator [Rhizomicrobium sp.]